MGRQLVLLCLHFDHHARQQARLLGLLQQLTVALQVLQVALAYSFADYLLKWPDQHSYR